MRFNRSEPGIVVSSVAHAALIGVAVIGLWQARPYEDHQEAIPVEMVSEAELNQIMRGEREAKQVQPEPKPKAERVAEAVERKPEAPVAPRDVEAPAGPAQAERDAEGQAAEQRAAEARARAEAQARAEAEAKAEAQAKAEADAKQRAEAAERARQAAAAEKARQAAAEQARREAEAKEAEERRAEEERQRRQAEAKALREKIEREQREAEAREERQRAEAERARAAEAKRVAEERARKAAEEKKAAEAKRDAEAKSAALRRQAEQKPFNPTEIDRLLQNRQQAQSTGSAAPQPQRQASLGAPNATAQRMTPSDREALIDFLRSRMRDCISVPPGSNRNARPEVRVLLTRDGALAAPPALVGGDRAVGEAAARGIRACAPYRIPARFAGMYEDWRALLITIDASDLN